MAQQCALKFERACMPSARFPREQDRLHHTCGQVSDGARSHEDNALHRQDWLSTTSNGKAIMVGSHQPKIGVTAPICQALPRQGLRGEQGDPLLPALCALGQLSSPSRKPMPPCVRAR